MRNFKNTCFFSTSPARPPPPPPSTTMRQYKLALTPGTPEAGVTGNMGMPFSNIIFYVLSSESESESESEINFFLPFLISFFQFFFFFSRLFSFFWLHTLKNMIFKEIGTFIGFGTERAKLEALAQNVQD